MTPKEQYKLAYCIARLFYGNEPLRNQYVYSAITEYGLTSYDIVYAAWDHYRSYLKDKRL